MSSAAPPEPSSRPRGSRRRFLLIASALCLLFAGGVLYYDVPLDPYAFAQPVAEEVPDPAENGYFYLKREWEHAPVEELRDRWSMWKVTSRAIPWDEGLAARVRTGQERVVAALRRAADLPQWAPPLIVLPEHGRNADSSPHHWLEERRAITALEACAAARAGDAEGAFAIWRAKRAAAASQIEGARDEFSLFAGLMLQTECAVLACDLLAWLPEDAALLARMEEHWKEDPLTDAVMENALRGELRWLWAELDRSGPLWEDQFTRRPSAARLLVKRNVTMNRCAALVRAFGGRLLTPASSLESSFPFAFEKAAQKTNPVSPNYFGDRMAAEWARSRGLLLRGVPPLHRFMFRAMRVRLALQRWRLARGETPPAALEELVPGFLPEIPADPWNGGPLGWDPATWTVSAVGWDWKADPSPPSFQPGGWIDPALTGPALRAKLPPAAAGPP